MQAEGDRIATARYRLVFVNESRARASMAVVDARRDYDRGRLRTLARIAQSSAGIFRQRHADVQDDRLYRVAHGETMNTGFMRKILQYPAELERFIVLARREGVRSYLEVGCKFGGSLWRIAQAIPRGGRIVAVDLPHGDTSFKESQPHLEACVRQLQAMRYDAHLFIGDSTDLVIVGKVRALAPFDLCLIDANHTEPYVRKDWANYGSMARIVAFHDIAWRAGNRPPSKKFPIEVPKVWAELKQQHRHEEIKLDPTRQDNGFGILWH